MVDEYEGDWILAGRPRVYRTPHGDTYYGQERKTVSMCIRCRTNSARKHANVPIPPIHWDGCSQGPFCENCENKFERLVLQAPTKIGSTANEPTRTDAKRAKEAWADISDTDRDSQPEEKEATVIPEILVTSTLEQPKQPSEKAVKDPDEIKTVKEESDKEARTRRCAQKREWWSSHVLRGKER